MNHAIWNREKAKKMHPGAICSCFRFEENTFWADEGRRCIYEVLGSSFQLSENV
jgi:hypothetical protein